jgi:hypothetical protein
LGDGRADYVVTAVAQGDASGRFTSGLAVVIGRPEGMGGSELRWIRSRKVELEFHGEFAAGGFE